MRRARCHSHAWPVAALVATIGLLPVPVGAGETDDDAVVAQAHDTHEEAGEHDARGEQAEPAGEHVEHVEHADQAGEHAGAYAGHHVHAEHRNGLGLYLGGTRVTAEDQTFFTLGFEYERLLADRWAVQVVVEHVNS